jgi:putative glutamine amidotransferase
MTAQSAPRPLIGITSYVEQAKWGVWDMKAALVPYSYVQQVNDAGGRAVLIPPASESAEVLRALDGLLLAGGADIDPDRYGAEPHPETVGLRPERDEGEIQLLEAALSQDLPVLGICRGMQLMSVAAGGRLHQHLPDLVGHEGHRPEVGVYGEHPVRINPTSQLGGILGDAATVRSYHHQGVSDAGKLTVVGWAPDDTVEAVEDPSRRFAIGVLWHPEVSDDPRIFEALVAAASAGA